MGIIKKKNPKGFKLNSNARALKFAQNRKKSSLKKKFLSWGTAMGLSAMAAMGGKKILSNQKMAERRNAAIEKVIIKEKLVNNPHHWAKICEIYKLNPLNPANKKLINSVDKLSSSIKVSPARIIKTLVLNERSIKKGMIDKTLAKLERDAVALKRVPTAYSKTVNIINILKWAKENPKLANEILDLPKFGTGRKLSNLIYSGE